MALFCLVAFLSLCWPFQPRSGKGYRTRTALGRLAGYYLGYISGHGLYRMFGNGKFCCSHSK